MAEEAGTSTDQTTEATTATTETKTETAPEFKAVTSQEQFDAMVKDRIARERAKTADYDDLKKKAARLDELEAENATELEKAQKRADEAEQQAAKAEAESKEIKLRSAILAEAAKPERKIVDLEAVLTLLNRNELELDEDGNPKNIAAAMDSLLAAKPFLVAAGGARPNGADQGARGGAEHQLSREAFQALSPVEQRDALKEGKADTLLKGG